MSSRAYKRIICLVSNDLVHDQRMQRICGSLHEAGHEVVLVGRKRRNSAQLPVEKYEQVRLNLLFEKGFLFYKLLNIRLFLFLLFNRFDIVYAVDMDTLPAGWMAARLKGKKCVYDAHEYFSESPELQGRGLVKSFWQWLEKLFIPRVDAAITVSSDLSQLMAARYGKPFYVVKNLPVYYPYHKHEKPGKIIFYQGALNMGRGLEVLISAMHELPCKLLIAGEGDLSEKLREMVIKEGLAHRVEFLGWLTPQSLKTWTQQAWLGVNLLEAIGYSYQYSLANKFFDYVMAGVPVLCTPFPEYVLADSKYHVAEWVTGLTLDNVVAAVRGLLKDEGKYDLLAENCLAAREVWNWENEKQKLLTVIDTLG